MHWYWCMYIDCIQCSSIFLCRMVQCCQIILCQMLFTNLKQKLSTSRPLWISKTTFTIRSKTMVKQKWHLWFVLNETTSWWLAVSTPLKNISRQNGNLCQVGMKIKKYLKPPSSDVVTSLHCILCPPSPFSPSRCNCRSSTWDFKVHQWIIKSWLVVFCRTDSKNNVLSDSPYIYSNSYS